MAARRFADARSRWAGVGPYYAMFPAAFADRVVRRYTSVGGVVLDPFAGRGTSVFAAATQNRTGIGIEINPVGYVYAKAKISPAPQAAVEARLRTLGGMIDDYGRPAAELPEFFHRCYSKRVRRFLVAARSELDWRRNRVDRTLMGLLLVYLHGKSGAALSNQLRQTKAMSPQYAIKWWGERGLVPPDIDPLRFMLPRVVWRYAKGIPSVHEGKVYLGDSKCTLMRVAREAPTKADLLFTSPPYHGITNYHYDQWLRLWLLGYPPNALRNGNGRRGKFEARDEYEVLLRKVFTEASRILDANATVYVRTDRRRFTYTTTLKVLRAVFPKKLVRVRHRPLEGQSQTRLFGAASAPITKSAEVDLILTAERR